MEKYFHGSGILFDRFDLAHALEGDGKVKFGYGVYVTSAYSSAAHYSAANPDWTDHYVYSVDVPEKTDENFIAFKQPVNPSIIARAEEKLGARIPEKVACDGKLFRKHLAEKVFKSETKLEGEKKASQFLVSIGVDFIEWPYNWKNPDAGMNRAILDDSRVIITRIDKVAVDDKKKLVPGSETQIR